MCACIIFLNYHIAVSILPPIEHRSVGEYCISWPYAATRDSCLGRPKLEVGSKFRSMIFG